MTSKRNDQPRGEQDVATAPAVPVEPGDEELGLTELLRDCLGRPAVPEGAATWKHLLVENLLRRAAEGDLKALQEIWTRLEGKPGASRAEEPDLPEISHEVALRILRAAGDDDDGDLCYEDGGGDEHRDEEDE
jgi:hypothetical protein